MRRVGSNHRIFVVNTGSTTTKLALFHGARQASSASVEHTERELGKFDNIWDQFDFRLRIAETWLKRKKDSLSAVVGIGGLLKSVEGGIYEVGERMIADARANVQGEHAANLGCALAYRLAEKCRCQAFVVDPVSVDEFEPLARYSGHPSITRRSLSHALNIHAAVKHESEKIGRELRDTNFVVAHLGGGISVTPVCGGKIVDANDASSDGPFSPERTGGLPLQQFISICFSGKYSEQDVKTMVMGKGGLIAYLGTNSAREVEDRIRSGDKAAEEVFRAMAYQVAKEIGAMSTVLKGRIDAILIIGGLARSRQFTKWIKERVDFIAPFEVYPGEDEMKSMALATLRALEGEERILKYE